LENDFWETKGVSLTEEEFQWFLKRNGAEKGGKLREMISKVELKRDLVVKPWSGYYNLFLSEI
jgi:hypothetical protein